MDSRDADIEFRRFPVPHRSGPRVPTSTEVVLGAVLVPGLIAYPAYGLLTARANGLERDMDHVQAARGAVEAR